MLIMGNSIYLCGQLFREQSGKNFNYVKIKNVLHALLKNKR